MRDYLEHVADRRLAQLGLAPLYGSTNPFAFMELQDVQELSNFFERRVSAYQVGVTGDGRLRRRLLTGGVCCPVRHRRAGQQRNPGRHIRPELALTSSASILTVKGLSVRYRVQEVMLVEPSGNGRRRAYVAPARFRPACHG